MGKLLMAELPNYVELPYYITQIEVSIHSFLYMGEITTYFHQLSARLGLTDFVGVAG